MFQPCEEAPESTQNPAYWAHYLDLTDRPIHQNPSDVTIKIYVVWRRY